MNRFFLRNEVLHAELATGVESAEGENGAEATSALGDQEIMGVTPPTPPQILRHLENFLHGLLGYEG